MIKEIQDILQLNKISAKGGKHVHVNLLLHCIHFAQAAVKASER